MSFYEQLSQVYDEHIQRLETSKSLLEGLEPPKDESYEYRALLAEEIFSQVIEDFGLEIIFECHKEAKQAISTCSMCLTKAYVDLPGVDIFGQDPQGGQNEALECPNCKREYPSGRFAAHMDKCMGLSSRRTATRRAGVTSNVSTPVSSQSVDNHEETDRKRKQTTLDPNHSTKKRK
ncbi:hypothetical protein BB558_004074 [Smittium angustum]|uniref:SAGA-associated factor 11 n=1 Tax=Smittium angustum TaxID=133377 RepID=A0A2U1J485_SMIAN|nr:hypothetical protein BB558_006037 [Smittium angustum]PVZ99889.1 hypothetical protein BB558_004074 [Smittium angustum]